MFFCVLVALLFRFPEGNLCFCFKHCRKLLFIAQNHCIKILRGRSILVTLAVYRYSCKILRWVCGRVLFCDLLMCFRNPVICRCLSDDGKKNQILVNHCAMWPGSSWYFKYFFEICFELFCRLTSFLEKLFQIVSLIENNSVVIVQGATGSGKSTQIPQYILDYCIQRSIYCNIAVTQPRKIGASSIARWISKERSWTLGELVGYQV